MPKSRTRKSKKQSRNKPRGGAAPVPGGALPASADRSSSPFSPTFEPAWFGEATERVLRATHQLAEASDQDEVEDAVGNLLGTELSWALNDVGSQLRFEQWFRHVLESAAARAKAAEPAERIGLLRLAHGMVQQSATDYVNAARAHYATIRRAVLRDDRDAGGAAWLLTPPERRATGRVWLLFDEPDVRLRYVIESSSRASGNTLYLVEIDACWIPMVAAATRVESLAEAAGSGEPRLVEHAELLEPLAAATWDREILTGRESAPVLSERFQLYRRIDDLETALPKQGRHLPRPSRDRGMTMAMMEAQEEFLTRYQEVHGEAADEDAASLVLTQWNEHAVPGSEWTITEHRVESQRNLLGDYEDTEMLIDLLGAWVRYLGERTEVDPELVDRAVAVVGGAQRSPDACADMGG